MNALSKTMQIVLLLCFVAASVATSPGIDPGPRPLSVNTLPTNANGGILVPRNGSFFTYGVFEATATSNPSIPSDGGAPVDEANGEPIVLDVEQQMPLEWARVDVSTLSTDVVYDVQLSVGAPADEFNTAVLQVMRTSIDDVTPPSIGQELVVEQVLFQEGDPDEPEPAVSVDSSVEGSVERCALSLEYTVSGVSDDGGAVLLYLYQDGALVSGNVFWSDPQTLQLWLNGDNLPREETCFRVVAADLAGNESSTDEVCIIPEGVDACV